jgi:hypothetical protein
MYVDRSRFVQPPHIKTTHTLAPQIKANHGCCRHCHNGVGCEGFKGEQRASTLNAPPARPVVTDMVTDPVVPANHHDARLFSSHLPPHHLAAHNIS